MKLVCDCGNEGDLKESVSDNGDIFGQIESSTFQETIILDTDDEEEEITLRKIRCKKCNKTIYI